MIHLKRLGLGLCCFAIVGVIFVAMTCFKPVAFAIGILVLGALAYLMGWCLEV